MDYIPSVYEKEPINLFWLFTLAYNGYLTPEIYEMMKDKPMVWNFAQADNNLRNKNSQIEVLIAMMGAR